MSGVILLHWDADGALHWLATEGVKVVCVDERAPDDRVYLSEGSGSADVIRAVAKGTYRDIVDAVNAQAEGRDHG